MAECEAKFDPGKWKHEFGIDPVTEDHVDCTREQISESNYCKYHSSSKTRKKAGISDSDVIINLLHEDDAVFEPKFQSVTIEDTAIDIDDDAGESPKLQIVHPIVQDKLEIKGCEFGDDFRIINGLLGDIEIRHPESVCDIEFRRSVVTGNLSIFADDTRAKFLLNQTDIYGHTEINSTFDNKFIIDDSRFKELVYIEDCTFKGGLDLSGSEFWDSIVINKSDIYNEARFHSIATDFLLYISECNFESIDLDIKSCFENLIRIYYSEIEEGTLRQQDRGTTYFDLSYSTLGNVDVLMKDEGLETLHISDCDYTEFDFTQIRNQLKESNWYLHDFGIDWGLANIKIRKALSNEISKVPYRTYIDQFHMRNYVETYIKSKERASRQGDSRSASEFLINEMRAKRKKRSHNSLTSDFGWREQLNHSTAQAKNIFLDYSCGFGEKPWKAAAWAIGFPTFLGAFLFPSIGGVENPDTGQKFAFSLDGKFDLLLGTEILLKNIYFSILSFSTIGSNYYVPATLWSHILMAVESLSGPFLVALFVFTLGKQVTR
ncbi:potassium channel family protein [Natrinema halophilum]|uniref:Two pore domain potassium channel family protein n=1 Tax=Natrinema halophilum TaxID=1699371 RepID=A0A7D5GR57_9EURY|nr:potassium channel family protein [Natrinema halophilum]QLG48329.1 potassium channel family protein [Natrinema halophilum]